MEIKSPAVTIFDAREREQDISGKGSSDMDVQPISQQNGTDHLNAEALALMRRALSNWNDIYGAGNMSCAVYDTAWIALVTKTIDGEKRWLFPECFHFLLDTQADDGSWGNDKSSQIDGILNTAASLLALKRHAAEPLNIRQVPQDDLIRRIDIATASLQAQLAVWRVSTTTHVGFEVIVPALFEYLKQEDATLVLDFQGRPVLDSINALKMSHFRPGLLYSPTKLTALHSLEAFIGIIDFDKVAHHKVQGSMMASPSSTAAYLMNASTWDDEAEAYIREVIKSGAGRGSGGVPSAYPSMHFEYTWILSTLFRAGFSASDLDCPELRKMKEVLVSAFEQEDGIIGFAPRLGADVDDTAKGIISLGELGYRVGPEKMIEEFESESHFKTYRLERNPSFSANANALLALLHQPEAFRFTTQILKAAKFLCDYWWNSDNKISDKWNVCYLYSSVLIVEAFTELLAMAEQGSVELGQELLSRVAISLFQACLRTLLAQEENGSWNGSTEETAYGVIILAEARQFALFDHLQQPLASAIQRGVAFIQSTKVRAPSHIWIEKVNYASPHLTDCYALAALKITSKPAARKVGSGFFSTSSSSMHKRVKLFQLTPLFSTTSGWQLWASVLEASLFQPLLRARRLNIFPRKDMEEDKYFDIIPFTWTACNNRNGTFASTSFIYEMMIISFLNYQADEFMEAVAGQTYAGREDILRQVIDATFSIKDTEIHGYANGDSPSSNGTASAIKLNSANDINGNGYHVQELVHEKVSGPLSKFVAYVSKNPSLSAASPWDRESTKRELRNFLHAHVTQSIDNARFGLQPQDEEVYSNATDTFFRWVRTTSADHTSCPYSFSFVSCLLSAMNGGRECFSTVSEKYLASAMCRHLATMCRMYNDFGSVARDKAEGNLNSVNFPEFETISGTGLAVNSMDAKKKALFELAEYERSCLDEALRRLSEKRSGSRDSYGFEAETVKERQIAIWRMFCDVTDLYGQIYVVRDIASGMIKPAASESGKV